MLACGRTSPGRWWSGLWVGLIVGATTAGADEPAPSPEPQLVQRDLSGPRVGVTYRPDGDTRELGRLVSQFGWHMETQVSTPGGPEFLIEFIPLVAGVEYGKFLPNASLAFGVRTPQGYEFGVGPNVGFGSSRDQGVGLRSAIFVAAGRSYDLGGIHVPVNLAVSINRDGARPTLLVGYAIRRDARIVEP